MWRLDLILSGARNVLFSLPANTMSLDSVAKASDVCFAVLNYSPNLPKTERHVHPSDGCISSFYFECPCTNLSLLHTKRLNVAMI